MSIVVFTFGRFQPPTLGHRILINAVKNIAITNNADYAVYVSRTQDRKTNPLSIDVKMQFLHKMFPDTNLVAANDQVRTFIEAAKYLNQKFTNIIMVAGSDRVESYNTLLNKYNGIEFNFNSIKVISAGERDPDSDSEIGMSGTKMRQAAIDNNIKAFNAGVVGLDDHDAQLLMQHIRGLVIK